MQKSFTEVVARGYTASVIQDQFATRVSWHAPKLNEEH